MSKKLFASDAIGNVIVPPPEVLLAWRTDAYPHGERRTWITAFSIPMIAASTVLVALRLGLRLRKRGGGFGLDDALMIPSWALLVAFTGLVVWSSHNGTLDRHMWDVDPKKYPTVALSAWLGQIVFLVGTCLIRISILLFYRRMVKGTFKKRWKWSVWVAMGFTIAWTLAFVIMLLATCQPVEANWMVFDPTYTKDWTCADTRSSNAAAGALAVVSDCYSLILPWAMTWPLQMPRRQKIALNVVFSFGIIVVIAAGLRTAHTTKLGTDYDSTWVGFWVYFWTALEWNLAIICNCAPSLRAFFRAYLKDTVDKALNSLSSRSKYRETISKDTMQSSQTEIELRKTIHVESEKPFEHGRASAPRDPHYFDPEHSPPREPVPRIPEAHARDDRRKTFLDMQGSPPEFVPTNSDWLNSQVSIVISGPEDTHVPPMPHAR